MKVALHTWTPETGLLPEVEPWAEPGEDLLLVWGPEVLLRAFLRFGRGAGDLRQSLILGCSGSGSILGPTVSDEHLVVARLRFLQTRLKVAGLPAGGPGRSRETGLDLAGCLRDDGLRHVLVFSDGLTVNGSELVEGLKEGLVPGVTLSGGLAGDGTHFRETHVVVGDRLASGWVGAVGFYGPSLHVRCASVGGWDPFGPVRRITRSQDNVLHELDGKSALSLYRTYLGPYARDLPASALYFPLSISAGDGRLGLVRTVLRIDEEEQSMVFAGSLPQGGQAQLMMANPDRLIEGAARAAELSRQPVAELALLVSCVGRRMVLGQRVEEELEAVSAVWDGKVPLAGYYSYGEISPFQPGLESELHNQTMTITTFHEGQG